LAHQFMADDRVARLRTARQHVEYALRDACLETDLGEPHGRERTELRTLEHYAVTRCERGCSLHRGVDDRAVPSDQRTDHAVRGVAHVVESGCWVAGNQLT